MHPYERQSEELALWANEIKKRPFKVLAAPIALYSASRVSTESAAAYAGLSAPHAQISHNQQQFAATKNQTLQAASVTGPLAMTSPQLPLGVSHSPLAPSDASPHITIPRPWNSVNNSLSPATVWLRRGAALLLDAGAVLLATLLAVTIYLQILAVLFYEKRGLLEIATSLWRKQQHAALFIPVLLSLFCYLVIFILCCRRSLGGLIFMKRGNAHMAMRR